MLLGSSVMRSTFAFVCTLAAALAAVPAVAAPDKTLGMAFLSASVKADGTLVRGAGAVASEIVGKGLYNVDFVRDVSTCSIIAGVSNTGASATPGQAFATVSSVAPNRVSVKTTFTDLTHMSRPFAI